MFTFRLYARDEDFNYRHGELPAPLRCQFGDQLDRARALLTDRTDIQLDYLLESLAWILKQGNELLFHETMEALRSRNGVLVSRVKALHAYLRNVDLSDQVELPNARPAEYFAALTLAYVGEALHSVQQQPRSPTERDNIHALLEQELARTREHVLNDMALEAMDAVGAAEREREIEQLARREAEHLAKQEVLRESFSSRGQLGGKIRAARFSELRQAIKAVYLKEYTDRSNRDAAKRLCVKFEKQIEATLRNDDPEKQLEKWIAQFRNEEDLPPRSRATQKSSENKPSLPTV